MLLYLEAGDEALSELHPAVGLVQMLVEITDPVNYSPYWFDQSGLSHAQSVFVTSGEHDEATPHRAATALAVAGRVPIVEPVVLDVPQFEWAGMPPQTAPLSTNIGGASTAGFIQWTDDIPGPNADSHWVIFHRPEAINASMRFLQSTAYEGGPKIERLPGADVR